MKNHAPEVWLCLSGGNALGAYHAGVYQALEEAGRPPARIAGASIGAVVGALIAGNPPDARMRALHAFWKTAQSKSLLPPSLSPLPDTFSRWSSLLQTLTQGRPGLFRPTLQGAWSLMPFAWTGRPSMFDTAPMRRTLLELIDFDLLKNGPVRLQVTAVDVETGEDVVFDSHAGGVEVEHLMASTAFPVAFPPVSIEGRVYVDPGVSANLPIAPLLPTSEADEVLCLAVDLVDARGRCPRSLDNAIQRTQELVFSSQSRHALRAALTRSPDAFPNQIAIIHLSYKGHQDETALKFFEFSEESINRRWNAGKADGEAIFAALSHSKTSPISGLYRLADGGIVPLSF
ncbi:MAG TPA: patatin-like phospholipase family protein [Pseudorhizobium sp.]|jgi:NTE family protein|nr:patatin-like phospholipase family protein [Pseudorhizobium sp.]